ncbi:MAG: hypothetical protein ACRCRW_00425, partial [Aeromonadaceae bacterium]
MTWLRLMLVALSGLLMLLLTLLGLLLFTSSGNQMIWQQLQRQLPNLQGELVSGHLGTGWEIHNLDFHSSLLDLKASKARLAWQAGALFAGKLIIDELLLDKPQLTLHPQPAEPTSEPDVDEPSTPNQLITLPVSLFVQQLSVQNFALQTPDVVVKVGALSAAADWQGDTLVLRRSKGADVDVALLLSQAQEPSQAQQPSKGAGNKAAADKGKQGAQKAQAAPVAKGKSQPKGQPDMFDPKY